MVRIQRNISLPFATDKTVKPLSATTSAVITAGDKVLEIV
jgi:hypothetical protein